ncbi:MAG: hypothetical protein AABM30_07585 [Actinomycetota bacterium]
MLILVGCGTSKQPKSTDPPPHVLGAPRVLVSAPGLSAFAQDHGQVAWWSGGRCPAVHIRTVATGAETRIPQGRKCALADFDGYPALSSFVFAGGRALWSVHTHGNSDYQQPQMASISDRLIRPAGYEIANDGDTDFNGEFLGGMAGDGATLVYVTYGVSHEESNYYVGGYSTTRVDGGKAVNVPGAPGAFAVAVSGRLAVLLPPTGVDDDHDPFSEDSTPVEVRDVQTGELVERIKHSGRAYGSIALTQQFVALLVQDGASTRLETYSVDGGHRQSQASVPSNATSLSIAGETVVFRTENTIHALNARSGRYSTVAVTKETPIGLSIEGRRIAWGENGRIVAVYLAAR